MVGLARPSVLEKVDEVLRGHRREAAVWVGSRAGVARVLWEGQGVTARAGKEDSSEDIRKDNNQLLIVYKMRTEVEEEWKIIALWSV